MRAGLFAFLFASFLFACQGDCASCHSKLDYKNDIRHQSMQECKTCHTSEKMSQIDMGGCGQDCFACHDTQKLLDPKLSKEHSVIQECIKCHAQISPLNSKIPSQMNLDFKNPFQNYSPSTPLISPKK